MATRQYPIATPTDTCTVERLMNLTCNADALGIGNLIGGLGATQANQIGASGAYPLQQQANQDLFNTTGALQGLVSGGDGIAPATDWQTVQSQVENAYKQMGNLNNAQQINADQQTLASGMGQRGLTGSTFNQSGQV